MRFSLYDVASSLVLEGEFGADGGEFVGGEGEMAVGGPGLVEGEEVDVGVGDVGADNFPEGALAGFSLEVAAEFFGGAQEGLVVGVGEVVDFVDLEFGDD